jgi:glycosyltransferase involved in cell wall biosynthesis
MNANGTMKNERALEAVDVVVRCRSGMPHAARTLAGLERQRGVTARVLFLDCCSTDGSREVAVAHGVRVIDVEPRSHVPAAALNLGMRETRSKIVVFMEADAFPARDALARLIGPLQREPEATGPAATYGRQRARGKASRDGAARFASMAPIALLRDAWETLHWDERFGYDEAAGWTRRIEALGFWSAEVREAAFDRAREGARVGVRARATDGEAAAAIYRLGSPSLLHDLTRPFAGSLLRDLRAGLATPKAAPPGEPQSLGYLQARRRALA